MLRRCLDRIAPFIRTGGVFHATCFLVPEDKAHEPFRQRHGILTYSDQNPFHYSLASIAAVLADVEGWSHGVIGDWNHPRHQQMLCFERR
jgi:hypothetical protein